METIYRDLSDRITEKKTYHREQTELDKKSVLFGKRVTYTYTDEGEQRITDKKEMYHKGGPFWGSMADLAEERFQTQVERLSLVHVTKYMPQKEDGQWVIPSTAQATDFRIPRNRVHFTIGHHVESHSKGNWDDSGIMIVAPLKGTMDLNGKPLGMSSVDTFFETSPNHKIVLPQGTHVFMPANSDVELDGKLSQTIGDTTYYKTTHFTDAEKKKIFNFFSELVRENGEYTYMMNVRVGDDLISVKEKDISSISDEICLVQSKKMMLEEHLQKNGYFTEGNWNFSNYETAGRGGCALVEETGEKLGCRWSDESNQLDFRTDFFLNDTTIVPWFNRMKAMDFIMHSDDYQITGVQDLENGDKEYEFKGPHYIVGFKTSGNWNIDDGIELLKHGLDIENAKEELVQNAEEHIHPEDKYVAQWTPAFQETYDVWSQKIIHDMTEYNALAKGFDFEGWQIKLQQRLTDYENQKSNGSKIPLHTVKQSGR